MASQDVTEESATTDETNFVLFDLRALARFDANKPQVVTLADTGTSRLLLIAMRVGQALPPQLAPAEASVQALRGRLRLSVGASSTELIMGRLAQIEARTSFALRALTDAVALVSLTPSPGEAALGGDLRGDTPPLVTRAEEASAG
jgi:quercetin dioxygenase-like cupin family protein